MALQTESQVIYEGRQGFLDQKTNPYMPRTWAYDAWNRGYNEASLIAVNS